MWLIYGGNGWIGKQFCDQLDERNISYIIGVSRLGTDKNEDIIKEIFNVAPSRIICLIGRTSGPGVNSIDYLEQPGKLVDNLRDNLAGPMQLRDIAQRCRIHLTYMGTGCIFNGYPEFGYSEDDRPDFFGSSYSIVKGMTDTLIRGEGVLNVRIRMPITDDLTDPKNFIAKIIRFPKICSHPNSMTYLPELLGYLISMIEEEYSGTINLVNPGLISHDEILSLYKKLVDPSHTWENISLDEQRSLLKADRSNNHLSSHRLQELFPEVKSITEVIEELLTKASS